MRRKPSLSTTAYAILGLLSLRPWSTYDLARQMRRTLHPFWPRAESHLYGGPKVLVAHGLASAKRHYVGKRARMVYAITPRGRLALRRWLSKPGAPPSVEFEGLIKVLFAEHGTRRHLLATLESIGERVRDARSAEAGLAREIMRAGGPLPVRLPVNALVFEFMWAHWEMVLRWVHWAQEQVSRWSEDMNPRTALRFAGPFQRAAREAARGGRVGYETAEPARRKDARGVRRNPRRGARG
jgi:PadR family transcriptional regulator, regulatory protein AphA